MEPNAHKTEREAGNCSRIPNINSFRAILRVFIPFPVLETPWGKEVCPVTSKMGKCFSLLN